RARTDALREWTERLTAAGEETLLLACDIRDGGVWSGVDQWIERLFPAIERNASGLLEEHSVELDAVLPHRKLRAPEALNLTDAATGGEAVRNYAMDRAYRLPHGVIDLLDTWYAQAPPAPRVVVCDGFDRAGALCRRFFRELVRRRGERLGITLVLAVSPGSAEAVRGEFG